MREIGPLENPVTAPWGRKITHSDYTKMLEGFLPQVMEQRWMVKTDTPDAQGHTILHVLRSWTSREMCRLDIKAGDFDRTYDRDWATIVEISWDRSYWACRLGRDGTEEEAKRRALLFCRELMGCELEDRLWTGHSNRTKESSLPEL
jgi:hypothetical protein